MFSEIPGKVSTEVLIEKKKIYVEESKSINRYVRIILYWKLKQKKISFSCIL